jgi:hypothetical protein
LPRPSPSPARPTHLPRPAPAAQPTTSAADEYKDGQGEIETAYTPLRYSGSATNFPRPPSSSSRVGSGGCQVAVSVSLPQNSSQGSSGPLMTISADAYRMEIIDVSRKGTKSCPMSLKGSSSSSSDYK